MRSIFSKQGIYRTRTLVSGFLQRLSADPSKDHALTLGFCGSVSGGLLTFRFRMAQILFDGMQRIHKLRWENNGAVFLSGDIS